MKNRSLILSAVLVLLLTAGAAAARWMTGPRTQQFDNHRTGTVFPSFAPEHITGITITSEGKNSRTLQLESSGGLWIIPTSENAAASRSAVSEFLSALSRTTPVRELPVTDEEMLKSLNLSSDDNLTMGAGRGIRLTLTKADGAVTMILGKAHVKQEDPSAMLNGKRTYDGRYIRVDDPQGKIHVFLVSRVFRTCIPAPGAWLEPLCLPSAGSGVMRIACSKLDPAGKPTILWSVMPNMTLHSFELVYPQGRVLAVSDLAKRLEVLTTPFSRDLIPAEEAKKISFTTTLQLDAKDGFTGTLYLARLPDGRGAAKLESSYRINRRTGETEEEFKRRNAALTARSAYEKRAFHDRVFLVSPELINLLEPVPCEKPAGLHAERNHKK